MNRIYRLVWNRIRSQWVAVSELAQAHGKAAPMRGRPARRFARWASWSLGVSLGLPALVFAAAPAVAPASLPTGGKISSGSGQIRQDGATLTVAQQSQNLSLNWQSFDIGAQATVNFVQPGQGAIAVNRIADTSGSRIMGHLNANGQVFLINPNGVLFGQGAQVNVGGLVASTLDVNDNSLGSGSLAFSGNGRGSVVNKGNITAAPGGYVALIGNQVVNQGWIRAQLGGVALAGGSAVTLSFDGDSLVDVRVDQSTVNALARNGQLLQADGGQVWMTAGGRDSLLASVVNNTGTVEAQTVSSHNGKILLLAGMQAGTVDAGGSLDASAPTGGDGGAIETSGGFVHIAADASLTTRAAGGKSGSWLIDPHDFTIAASGGDITGAQVSTLLANNSISIAAGDSGTTVGAGNIYVNDNISWNSNMLILSTANNININATLTAGGTAGLVLNPGTANGSDAAVSGGTVNVMPGSGKVNFTGTGNSLSINGTPYTIITQLGSAGSTTGTDLQGMNGNLGGHYALGADIDASATVGWNNGNGFTPIGAGNDTGITGVFDGLGHTISNLVIQSSNAYVGLFSTISSIATVRNVGLLGGSVVGSGDSADVGGLVGYHAGNLLNVFSTAAVTVTNQNALAGGLVGVNDGWLQSAYAAGAVSAQAAGDTAGGLAGINIGTIANAYATGSVSSSGGKYFGGLIGTNIGTVTDTYATGYISSNGAFGVGGLVGLGEGGSITGSYWDTQSTGQASSSGGTGVTSAQLRSALPSGFSPSTWGIVAGQSAPYLLAQFPSGTTPQVVSGTIYTESGTAGAGIPVSGLVDGKPLASVNGSVETGGNGYYDFLLAPGTLSNGDGVLVYANNYGAGSSGVSFLDGYSASNQQALNVYGNLLYVKTTSTTWSGVLGDLAVAEGNGATAGTALSVAGITPSYDIEVGAAHDFTVDSSINAREVTLGSLGDLTLGANVSAAGELQLNATGGISEINGALVSTALLSGTATGAVSLGNPNSVAVLGDFTANGFTFSNSEPLTVTGAVKGGSSTQIKSSSDLALDASATVSGGSVILVDGGKFTNKAGASALVDTGAWQLWSQFYGDDTLDGLAYDFRQYNARFGISTPLGGGNGIFYVEAPVATIVAEGPVNKTYDGSSAVSLFGVVITAMAGDGGSVNLPLRGSYENANAGADKTLTFAGYQLSFRDLATGVPIYGYQYNPVISMTGSITRALLTIQAGNSSKVYDGLPYAGSFAVTYNGFVNGETSSVLGGTLGFSGDALGAVNAGDYAVIPGGLKSANYLITFVPGQLQVTPASLSIAADGAGKIYDGLAYAGGSGVSYSGFVNGETSSVLGGELSYGGDAQGAVDAGTYAILPGGLTSGNYDISFVAGPLKISPAPLTVTANDARKVYDGRAYAGDSGVSYSGFVNDENASVLGGTLGYGGDAQGAVNVGYYAITANGLTSGNYAISYEPGQLSVTPAPLVITANSTGKTYDGLAFAGGDGVSYSGLVNGETSSVLGGTLGFGGDAQGAVNVGNYAITAKGLSSGNYAISYQPGQLSVTPAPLIVTANSTGKTYDGLAFAGGDGVGYSGFVNGETPSVLGGMLGYGGDAQGAVDAGSYAIIANGLTSGNYNISYQPGQLSVAPAPLIVTANAASKVYDGLGYAGGNGVNYSGFVNGETASVLGGMLTYGGDAQAAVNAGSYAIAPGGLTSGNYAISFAPGQLAITPAALTVSVNAAGKTYDARAYAGGNGVTYAGFVDGQNASVLGGMLVYGGSAQGAIDAGSYGLSASGLSSGNYAISYVPGALTISPAVLTYVASPLRLYDGQDPSNLGGTVTGFEGGDTLDNSTTGTLAWNTSATAQSAAGQYAILGGGLSARNYLFDEAAGNATALTIAFSGVPSGVGNAVAGVQRQLGLMAPAVPSRDSGPYAPDVRIEGAGMRLP